MNPWTVRDNLLEPLQEAQWLRPLQKVAAANLAWYACVYADEGKFVDAFRCAASAMEIFPRFWAVMAAIGQLVPAGEWEDGSQVEAAS